MQRRVEENASQGRKYHVFSETYSKEIKGDKFCKPSVIMQGKSSSTWTHNNIGERALVLSGVLWIANCALALRSDYQLRSRIKSRVAIQELNDLSAGHLLDSHFSRQEKFSKLLCLRHKDYPRN